MNEVKNLPTVVRSRELRRHGMRIQLKEKPFQILEPLIESAGQVVRRKTLCEKLWPDTHVVFDHSLNTAINKLRSVLADLAQTSSIHDELRHRTCKLHEVRTSGLTVRNSEGSSARSRWLASQDSWPQTG